MFPCSELFKMRQASQSLLGDDMLINPSGGSLFGLIVTVELNSKQQRRKLQMWR